MSVVDNLSKYNQEIEAEVKNMQQKILACETGMIMLEASQIMATSEEMMGLMEKIGDPEISEEERLSLAKQMGQMIQDSPSEGLENYAKYLESIAQKPENTHRKEYYLIVANSARSVHEAKVYQDYIVVYNEFEKDNSPEAKIARQAMQDMQMKMQKWSNG